MVWYSNSLLLCSVSNIILGGDEPGGGAGRENHSLTDGVSAEVSCEEFPKSKISIKTPHRGQSSNVFMMI